MQSQRRKHSCCYTSPSCSMLNRRPPRALKSGENQTDKTTKNTHHALWRQQRMNRLLDSTKPKNHTGTPLICKMVNKKQTRRKSPTLNLQQREPCRQPSSLSLAPGRAYSRQQSFRPLWMWPGELVGWHTGSRAHKTYQACARLIPRYAPHARLVSLQSSYLGDVLRIDNLDKVFAGILLIWWQDQQHFTHSEETATQRPVGSADTHRTGMPFVVVIGASSWVESLEYRLTSASTLPDSQQSSCEKLSAHQGWKPISRTVVAMLVTPSSASIAVSGSCSSPSSTFHILTMQSWPPVKTRLRVHKNRSAEHEGQSSKRTFRQLKRRGMCSHYRVLVL